MTQYLFHKLVLKYPLISQSGLLTCSNYLQLFGVKFVISFQICITTSPSDCPPSYLQYHEDGYKDRSLRICFRVKSNGEFKFSCLPSCSMIYLKHPSFGIQLKHLTTKKRRSYRHLSMRNQKCMQDMQRGPIPPLSLPSLLVVFSCTQFFPRSGETESCKRCLIILVILLA